jgi:hypothetical protein
VVARSVRSTSAPSLRTVDMFVMLPGRGIVAAEHAGATIGNEFPRPGSDLSLTLNARRYSGPALSPMSIGAPSAVTANVTAVRRQKGRMATARISLTVKIV